MDTVKYYKMGLENIGGKARPGEVQIVAPGIVQADENDPGQLYVRREDYQALIDAVGGGGVNGVRLMRWPDVNADMCNLMAAIVLAGQKARIIRADLETVSMSECLHILDCMVKDAAPVIAEPVAQADRIPYENFPCYLIDHCEGEIITEEFLHRALGGMLVNPKYAAPVAAQPDLTQQTLDDVKAGIPARDAEIEALRKELETLQAEVLNMVQMLEANEWADHCGKSELGQRLEWAITALQNRIAELTKSSSQQDADKVDAWQCTTTLTESDDLIWLYCQDTNTIDGPVASSPEFIDSWTHWAWVKHPSTASIDAARKVKP